MSWRSFLVVAVLRICNGDIPITLTSSIDGRRAALNNEQLTFICVISGNTLVWRSTLDLSATGFIGFIRSVDNEGASKSVASVGLAATLTSKANSLMNSTLQLTVGVRFNESDIQCTNGAFTPVVSKTLFIAVNPGPPSNVSVPSYTLSSLTLTWKPPLFGGLDDIFRYTVAVSSVGGLFVANMSSATTSATIPSLQYNTPYTFEVKAVNRVGASPGAVYNFVISSEDPPIPVNLTAHELCGNSSASLVLTWQPPLLSYLVPRPVLLVVNVTQAGQTTVAQLQPNVSSYIINKVLIHQKLDITFYLKSPVSNGKSTNIEISISDHITSSEVTARDTSARVVCTSCYGSPSALLLTYYKCDDSANDTPALKVALGGRGGGEGGVYLVEVSSLTPNTTYCYAVVLYDPTASKPIGPPAMGRFVTNVSLQHPASVDSCALPSSSPATPVSAGVGSVTSVVAGIGTGFAGLTILLLSTFVTIRCCLKKRKTQLSIQLRKSKSEQPPRNFDPVRPDHVDEVQTVDNVAYCTVVTANALIREKGNS